MRSFFQPIGDKGKEIGQPIGDKLKEVGAPIGPAMREGYASAYSNPNLLSGIVTEVPEMLSNMVSSSQSTLPDATEIQPVVKADGPGTLSGDNFIVAPDEVIPFLQMHRKSRKQSQNKLKSPPPLQEKQVWINLIQ